MSSLWTPDGERRVSPPTTSPGPESPGPHASGDDTEVGEVDPVAAAELQELRRELLAAPAEEVIANHCYGLFELAALHLGDQPPNFDKARLAIDALGAVVATLGERLGPHAGTFTDGLAQLRLAWVQLHQVGAAPDVDGGAPTAAGS